MTVSHGAGSLSQTLSLVPLRAPLPTPPPLYPGFKFVFKSLPKPSSHISLFCSGDVSRRLHIFLLFWPVHLTQTMKGRRIYLGSWFPRCWSIVMEGEVRSSRHGCQEAEKYNTGRKLSTISPQRQAPRDVLSPARVSKEGLKPITLAISIPRPDPLLSSDWSLAWIIST